jgi:hypothetical protein
MAKSSKESAPEKALKSTKVFCNKPFARFAKKFRASNLDLLEMCGNFPDADLGGGVYKFRLAREGEGDSGGARTIVAMKSGERVVMMYGFEKKDLANIDPKDLKAFKKLAKAYLNRTDDEMEKLVQLGELLEITR